MPLSLRRGFTRLASGIRDGRNLASAHARVTMHKPPLLKTSLHGRHGNKQWDMWKNGWILAAGWLWLFAGSANLPATSSTFVREGASYTIDKWDSEDELPENAVIALTQTRDGYLWLGTLNGLVRFDGIHFEVFDENNTPGLNSSQIIYLFEDSQGRLWIGTQNAGVVVMKDGQVSALEIGAGSADRRLFAACEDANGAVWLHLANGELWRCGHGSPRQFFRNLNEPSLYRALIAERAGPVWVGTDDRQFAIAATSLDGPVEKQQEIRLAKLDFLLASRGGGYWRLANGWVQKCRTNRVERNLAPYPWEEARVTAACEDREGNLLVAIYGAGIFWFDAEGKATRLSTSENLSHNIILSLYVDREGTLWVGTDGGGLNRVKRQVFDLLPESRGLVVQSVSEDRQGGLWIGSNGGEVGYWTNGFLRWFGPNEGLKNFSVKAILADRKDRVWVGTWANRGSGLFQLKQGRFQQVPAERTIGSVVSAIHEDRDGRLWLGTQEGLVRWDGRDWMKFTTRDGLSSDVVRAIADDHEGNLWVGTGGGGLSRLRDGRFTSFHKKDGLPNEDISSLYADEEGVLWVGTSGSGLGRFHAGKWTRYTKREGLISNSIGYLLEDGQGYLWIGSNAGLMRVEKKALNNFAHGAISFIPVRAYRQPDGLPTRECTAGSQPGACRTREGKLWFPTIKGLASMNPAQFMPNTNPPPVVIQSVFLDGQAQNTNGLLAGLPPEVNVEAGKERVEIHYTSLNLAAPERARFRYRLAKYETAWNEAGDDQSPVRANGSRVAVYRKLPPGHYRFEVTACNEDGVWNETGTALGLTVQPPVWRTWWFLTSAIASLLGTMVVTVHYLSTQRLHRQLERLRQQEALEKERARIARDIHDQLGASLTQVSLLGEFVESDKDSPAEVEAHARQICQTARDTTRVLDEIVWTVNPSNDTLDGLVTYVCKYAQEYLAVAGLRYRLDVPAELPGTPVPPELRHNVFLAAKEAVTNVVRHAKASSVWIRLRLEPGNFFLEIQDNGRGMAGMDEKRAQSRNGLTNMRKRMEDIGGSYSIGPAPDGGTVVRLSAPLGRESGGSTSPRA